LPLGQPIEVDTTIEIHFCFELLSAIRGEVPLAFNQAFFEDFFVAEPQIGDVGGAEAEDVFEGAAHFPEMEIHADALEQFDEFLRTYGLHRLRPDAVVIQSVKRHNVNGLGTGAMTVNMQETPGFGLGRGEPRGYT
jgi:hypothetical protein